MKSVFMALPLLALSGRADAHMPLFEAECGRGLEVHSDIGGPVYINGRAAPMMRLGDDAYQAKSTDVVLTLSVDADDIPVAMRATWTSGGNGACHMHVRRHPHQWGRGLQLLSDVDGVVGAPK